MSDTLAKHSTEPTPSVALYPALGICQMIGFGTSLYLLTMLAQPMAADSGWPQTWIVSGLTIGLLFGALLSPAIGRAISEGKGRWVLSTSSILFAIGLAIISLASRIEIYFLGWLILGAGMATGLYDACFGTIGRAFGGGARRVISVVALIGGLASTIFWPLSQYLTTTLNWRETCLVFAAMHVLICLPIYVGMLPDPQRRTNTDQAYAVHPRELGPDKRRNFRLFGAIMVLESALAAMVAVNLVALLGVNDVSPSAAAFFGALIGPSQIAVRLADTLLGSRIAPIYSLLFSSVAISVGLILLGLAHGTAGVAMVLYGFGIGLFSITRASFPLHAFGRETYPALMGLISRGALIAQAIGPLVAAIVASRFTAASLLTVLIVMAVAKIGLCLAIMFFAKAGPQGK